MLPDATRELVNRGPCLTVVGAGLWQPVPHLQCAPLEECEHDTPLGREEEYDEQEAEQYLCGCDLPKCCLLWNGNMVVVTFVRRCVIHVCIAWSFAFMLDRLCT